MSFFTFVSEYFLITGRMKFQICSLLKWSLMHRLTHIFWPSLEEDSYKIVSKTIYESLIKSYSKHLKFLWRAASYGYCFWSQYKKIQKFINDFRINTVLKKNFKRNGWIILKYWHLEIKTILKNFKRNGWIILEFWNSCNF
jgi:hypothetical protein